MLANEATTGNEKRLEKAIGLRQRQFWCKTFVRLGGLGNDENRFTESSDFACHDLCAAGGRADVRRSERDCGENKGRAKVRWIFQFVLGRKGRQVVVGDRKVGYGISLSERLAGGRRFERHWAGSWAVERDAGSAVRTERAQS